MGKEAVIARERSDRSSLPRELYFLEGIRYLPHLLELVDRNRLSRTYGCFDRSFWHYRTSDFPSGMYQECVLPLALVHTLKHPQNPFFQQERLKELVWAGIDFARRSSHRDGSCDDYFPYERASGATAFSLYAATEACLLLKLKSAEFLRFFKKRGRYLAGSGYGESGTLSNHRALIVLSLYNVFLLTGEDFFKKKAEERLAHLLSLQSGEGWFPEYEGCDPGYLTFTIDFLAKYFQKSKDEEVLEPLRQAVAFSSHFVHPDGSYGGEYGSRNTHHFLPHGFELMGRHIPLALGMANLFLEGVQNGRRSHLEDDRIFCHYVYNFLQAYRDFCPREEAVSLERGDFTRFFEEAGIFVKSAGGLYAVIAVAKGGTAKIFKGKELLWSDGGLVGKSAEGRTFISQVSADFQSQREGEKIIIEGNCYEHRDFLFSPFSFLLFRLFLMTVGRFLPANVVRSFLQHQAILKKKKKFPLRFKKVFSFDPPGFIECAFHLEDPSVRIQELWIGTDPTFIYVATSRPYQTSALKKWTDLLPVLPELNEKRQSIFRLPLE